MSGPLLDGTVVSESILPDAIRQTIVSLGRRRILDSEKYRILIIIIHRDVFFSYQLVHIRRRQQIQEFGRKYAHSLSFPDFLVNLLHS